MLKSIVAFFAGLFSKHVSMAGKLFQDFIASEQGKKILEVLKRTQDKEAKMVEALNSLKEQALALAKNDAKLTQKVLDYLKKKILAEISKK
jgi:hypothetical protein